MVTYLIYRLEAKVFILRNWNFINTERDSDKMLLSFLRFKGGNPVDCFYWALFMKKNFVVLF